MSPANQREHQEYIDLLPPPLDSLYRMSSCFHSHYMHTCSLRATSSTITGPVVYLWWGRGIKVGTHLVMLNMIPTCPCSRYLMKRPTRVYVVGTFFPLGNSSSGYFCTLHSPNSVLFAPWHSSLFSARGTCDETVAFTTSSLRFHPIILICLVA